ncbi:S-layer homology domain-containing protein [Psychrobacillus psychrotolerans]|uniref:S-layer homology domain-containing protein n=1 Tax=Psychrobacillus psychrotolerans TaxID=126156 RepID=UPI003B01E572
MKKIVTFISALILSLILALPTVNAASYSDIPSTHAYQKEISYLSSLNIINGYSDSTFKPSNLVTNRQAAVMLVRALKLENEDTVNPGFKDVPTTDSSYKEIAIATANGIFPKGTKFSPNSPITREGMARALANAFNLTGTYSGTFSDVSKDYWGYEYIVKLAANNITTGYDDGSFKPKNTLTRAHFSVFLARSINPEMRPTAVNKPQVGIGFYQGLVPKNYKNPVDLSYFNTSTEGYSGDYFNKASYTGSKTSGTYSLHLTDENEYAYSNHTYSEDKTQFTFDSHWTPKVTVKYPVTVGDKTSSRHLYKEYTYNEAIYDGNGEWIDSKEILMKEREETITNKVISINGTKDIGDKEFHNLIVIEQTTNDPFFGVVTYYFSKNEGLMGYFGKSMTSSKEFPYDE